MEDVRTELFHDRHFEGDEQSHYRNRVRDLAEQGWELISMAPHRMGVVALFRRVVSRAVPRAS